MTVGDLLDELTEGPYPRDMEIVLRIRAPDVDAEATLNSIGSTLKKGACLELAHHWDEADEEACS